ncbi:MAG TPA: peptidase [Rhizobiales bacterium]|uniref:Prepilin peptidase CpaA n=2 Tax=Cohaesibacter gelatinilyticus TaxID=372072 RepID=A0A285PG85_9HYPH|nr:prepilin peptidase CpaA [Cohaesibacter gelatinilyticus]HAT86027.1 peptidase [Hyphomicrobiales bacterium]
MFEAVFGWALLLFAPLVFAYAGSSDLFSMRISNKVALVLLCAFPLFAWGVDMGVDDTLPHLWTALIVLGGCFILWQVNAIGGGDAKFAAVAALWLGPHMTIAFLALASIYGAILAIFFLVVRSRPLPGAFTSIEWISRLYTNSRIPYGIALAASGMHLYSGSDWMRQGIEMLT